MKIEVIRLAIILKAIFLFVPCFAGDSVRETSLDWTHRVGNQNLGVSFNFRRVQFIRGSLKFEVIAHNMHKNYQCLFITASNDSRHMDDEFANEYRGAAVVFEGNLDNKLALNQKKIFTISIPAPKRDVSLVNLHFGLFSRDSGTQDKCAKPLVEMGYNFHQFNWDVSWIR